MGTMLIDQPTDVGGTGVKHPQSPPSLYLNAFQMEEPRLDEYEIDTQAESKDGEEDEDEVR